jgi:hypothetical protein
MSTQGKFSNSIETSISTIISNARQKEAKAKAKTDSIRTLGESINRIVSKTIIPATDALTQAEKDKNYVTVLQNAYKRTHSNASNPALTAQLKIAQTKIDKQTSILNSANAQINTINKKITDLGGKKITKVGKITIGTTKPPISAPAPQGQKLAFSKDYKYNAPMVKSAYFGLDSIQSKSLDKNQIDQGNYQDAVQAWKGVQGGRGTIQMDRKFIQLFDLSDPTAKFDLQKYGFKFLYNPTTVSMAWGLMSQMDPVFEAQGLDKFQVASAGLLSSTITFELMLNRIADFDYLNEKGLKSGTSPNIAAIDANLDPAQRMRMYNSMYAASNPYPETVSIEDQQEIYRKGTMHDIEYLLRTINGPNGDFKSALNGTTSDRGWMRPTIVELHLGNAMRYRVRIANLAVNHIMFNNRMVPILSKVELTCSRFNDGPTATSTGGSLSSSSTDKTATHYTDPVPGYGI